MRFENLLVWQRTRAFVDRVYRETSTELFRADPSLRSQLRRAAVSVMSNIAEGYERGSDAELCRFLRIARGSCGEARSQLYVTLDQRYLTEASFADLTQRAVELARMIRQLDEYAKQRGRK